jgi:hypothetical protein
MTSTEKKRILLIQCGATRRQFDVERFGFEPEVGLARYGAPNMPLACATIAALTPEQYDVDIWDENLRGQLSLEALARRSYDVVGVSVMFPHVAAHARALGKMFKILGVPVVAGGPTVSEVPEDFQGSFDSIFINEAERTWPQFLRDLEQGRVQPVYRQIDKPSMAESPRPDFGSIAAEVPRYEMGAVQTTRGCPFDCEFCDVIYLYGRRQRHKPVGQVVDEVRALEALGSRGVFFTDDEFVGDPAYAKELLSALVPVNNAFRRPLWFHTQLTLNLNRDEKLLELVRDANFHCALIGIESFNKASLRETAKHHNAVRPIQQDIRDIQSHGIGILGTFIVGFDHDGPDVFEQLWEGIQQTCVAMPRVNLLDAKRNTRLWARLRGEGRVATVRLRRKDEAPGAILNVTPGGMSRVELLEGYHALCEKLNSWPAILERIRGWISGVCRAPRVNEGSLTEAMRDRFMTEIGRSWGLSAGEHAAIGDTLAHMARVAPYLLPRVAHFLSFNQSTRLEYANYFTGYEKVIELERRGELIQDPRPLLLPSSFGAAVAGLFPELFTRLARSLPDERLIPEAMKQVLVDFLVRWGSTFRKVEPEHRAFLLELCDKATSKLGGRPANEPRDGEAALLQDARRRRLLDAVIKDVRDELAILTA